MGRVYRFLITVNDGCDSFCGQQLTVTLHGMLSLLMSFFSLFYQFLIPHYMVIIIFYYYLVFVHQFAHQYLCTSTINTLAQMIHLLGLMRTFLRTVQVCLIDISSALSPAPLYLLGCDSGHLYKPVQRTGSPGAGFLGTGCQYVFLFLQLNLEKIAAMNM